MTVHNLKIWPEWFNLVIHRAKEFELRKADRDFQPGDTLRLMEYLPDSKEFTGRVGLARITCVLRDMPGLLPGYVAMGVFFLQLETKHTAPIEEDEE